LGFEFSVRRAEGAAWLPGVVGREPALDDALMGGALRLFAVITVFLFTSFPPLEPSLLSAALYLEIITLLTSATTASYSQQQNASSNIRGKSVLYYLLGIDMDVVDRVTVAFHPLHEFQVVKRASFHKFADLNVLHPIMLSIKIYDTKWIKRQQSSVCYHTHNGIFRKSVGSSLEFWISLDPSTKKS
jgi:hypothetical protein